MSDQDSQNLRRRPRRAAPSAIPTDRLPPHSVESEQGILACVLLEPPVINEVIAAFGKSGAEVFYDLRHQLIFSAMVAMVESGMAIDTINLMQKLKDAGKLEAVGGLAYLAVLPDAAPSAANLETYLETVLSKFQMRRLVQVCVDTVGKVFDDGAEPARVLDDAERNIMAVRQTANRKSSLDITTACVRSIQAIEDYVMRDGGLLGLSTGFIDFDRMTGGLAPSDFIVIAARPSIGKTSLAMNVVEHVAVSLKVPVGVFSLEMNTIAVTTRMLCSMARVNFRSLRDGGIPARHIKKLTDESARLSTSPVYIDDTSGLTIMELRARARKLRQQHGVKLIVVDYLQMLRAVVNGKRIEKRQEEVAEISTGLKSLAKELEVPMLVLCQLNRDIERSDRKPVLSDLRESGNIEQDADVVGMLYRENALESETNDTQSINLLIAKQRNGPTGEVPLTFFRQFTRFESRAKIDPADVPVNTNADSEGVDRRYGHD